MRFRIIRIKGNRFPKSFNRIGRPLSVSQRDSQVVPSVHVIMGNGKDSFKKLDCFEMIASRDMDNPDLIECQFPLRSQLNRSFQYLESIIASSEKMQSSTKVEENIRMVGVDSMGGFKQKQRSRMLSFLNQNVSKIDYRLAILREKTK